MNAKTLLDIVKANPEMISLVREALGTRVSKNRLHVSNRTFRYMKVRPEMYSHNPTYPTNIWYRLQFFKPYGTGMCKGSSADMFVITGKMPKE
jgi:hypothetical protein